MKKLILFSILYSLFSIPVKVFALQQAEPVNLANPIARVAANLEDFVLNTIPLALLWAVAPITLLFFLISAMKYLFSAASAPTELAQAKNSMLYTAIGLLVVVGSYAIIKFVASQLG